MNGEDNGDTNLVPVSVDDRVALIKMENDTLFAAARAMPRDHKQIRAELVAQFDAYPGLAAACIYSKPVGRDKATGVMKYATGLSIRCAEALADVYGYNRVEAETLDLDADRVKIVATFTDFARVRVWRTSGILSKRYKDAHGKMQRTPDDRFYGTVCKAEASRLIREAIVRAVPPGLRTEIRAICERKMAGMLSDQGVKKIVDAFAEIGVAAEQLEEHLGRKTAKWTEADRLTLGKLFNAIDQEETTVAEVFAAPPQSYSPPASMDDLTAPRRGEEPKTTERPFSAEQVSANPEKKGGEAAAPKSKRGKKFDETQSQVSSAREETHDAREEKPIGRGLTREKVRELLRAINGEDELNRFARKTRELVDASARGWFDSACAERWDEIQSLQDEPAGEND